MPYKAKSPYNFVPHNRNVVIPEWQHISQDRPEHNGISGSLTIRVFPKTPLMIANKEKNTSEHGRYRSAFKLNDNANGFGIPGSSLRGMLRSVVETITFGKMNRMNDHFFGIRDLTKNSAELYGRHMAQVLTVKVNGKKKKVPTPLVCAGWLSPNLGDDYRENPAILRPCDYSKIEYELIQTLAKQRLKGKHSYEPGAKQSSPKKYAHWFGDGTIEWDKLKVSCSVSEKFSETRVNSIPRVGAFYHKLSLNNGGMSGHMVFTGQPSTWEPKKQKGKGQGNAKHHDFVFFDGQNDYGEYKIGRRLFEGFLTAHAGTGEQHKLTDSLNEELSFWMKNSQWFSVAQGSTKFEKYKCEIPVFFLLRENEDKQTVVRAMGLAQMFRLAYDHSTKELASQVVVGTQEAPTNEELDFAELLFGTVNEKQSRQGRIQIGHGRLRGVATELPVVKAILGSPKASFFPYYVEQDLKQQGGQIKIKKAYRTYMDDPKKARIRGRKRYVIRPAILPWKGNGMKVSEKVFTRFRPIEVKNGFFESQINLHNALPEEVGALVWALTFGGDASKRHQIGMAKSMGYGNIEIQVSDNQLYEVRNMCLDFRTPVSLNACMQKFTDWMSTQIPNWSAHRRIYELLELATPLSINESQETTHPDLGNKEFIKIKKDGLALPSRGTAEGFNDWKLAGDWNIDLDGRLPELPSKEQAIQFIEVNLSLMMQNRWYAWVLNDEEVHPALPRFSTIAKANDFLEEWNELVDLRVAAQTISDEGMKSALLERLNSALAVVHNDGRTKRIPTNLYKSLRRGRTRKKAIEDIEQLLDTNKILVSEVRRALRELDNYISEETRTNYQKMYDISKD